jgi:hypothetical protein
MSVAMKNSLTGVCVLTALILAIVCALLSFQKAGLEKRVAGLSQQLAENEAREHTEQAKIAALSRDRTALKLRAEALSAQIRTNRLAAMAASASGGGHRNALGEAWAGMIHDPDLKKELREQQTKRIEALYAALFKTLGLSPADAVKLKTMLVDQAMKSIELAAELFQPDWTKAVKADVLKQLLQEEKTFEAGVKALLGEARYAQYETYAATIGPRTDFEQFSQQLSASLNALNPTQSGTLLQIMEQEQSGMPAVFDPNEPGTLTEAAVLQAMMSEERMNELFQQIEQMNQRVLQRSANFLTQDQLQALAAYQNAEIEYNRANMILAAGVLGNEQPAAMISTPATPAAGTRASATPAP